MKGSVAVPFAESNIRIHVFLFFPTSRSSGMTALARRVEDVTIRYSRFRRRTVWSVTLFNAGVDWMKNGSAPVLAEKESPEAEKTARNGTDAQFSGPRSSRSSAPTEREKPFMILPLNRVDARHDPGLQVGPKARFEKPAWWT